MIIGGAVNTVLIVAIFIYNFPEVFASTARMETNGKSSRQVIILWSIAVFISTISLVIGFKVLSNTSQFIISIAISFATGAILVMLAESMIPEANEEGRIKIGIATMIGFVIAFVLGKLEVG